MINFTKINESWVHVDAEIGILKELEDALTFYAPSYQFHPAYKAKVWNGKSKVFSEFQRCLPSGLLLRASDLMKDYKQTFDDGCRKMFRGEWKLGSNLSERFVPHDFQILGRDLCLSRRRTTIESMTSSGKSLTIFMICDALMQAREKILIIVPSILLVTQMIDDFKDYSDGKVVIDGLGDNMRPSPNATCIVSTWQSAIKQSSEWLESFTALIVDEAHLSTGKSIKTIVESMTACHFRVGFSGSISKNQLTVHTITGLFGPFKNLTPDKKALMRRGIIAELFIQPIGFWHEAPTRYDAVGEIIPTDYNTELKIVEECPKRLMRLAKLAMDEQELGNTTLILCNTKAQCKAIQALIPNCDIIMGSVKPKAREAIKIRLNTSQGTIATATFGCMSTGISIKGINNVIFGSPVSGSEEAATRLLQSIGRLLRVSATKKMGRIYDPVDKFEYSDKLVKQFKRRRTHYKAMGGTLERMIT